MTDIIRREFDFFTVEAKKDTHHVDFTIYEGIGFLESFEEQVKIGIDSTLGPNYDDDPLVKGYVKWDGCSNWDFPLEAGVTYPLHFCGQQEIRCFGKMLAELYEWAAELMPEHKEMILEQGGT
jgi:hypothetical protein